MKKKILFLGQKEIGEQCFSVLYDLWKSERIELVVSSNVSNKVWWKSNQIYKVCCNKTIPFISNEKRDEELLNSVIITYDIDWILSVQHNWILSENTLKLVNYQALNLHLAKLPEYQGYCTFNHAILNDDLTYGVTLHWMTKNVDEGDIAYMDEFEILPTDTAYSLYQKSIISGLECFKKLIVDLNENNISRIKMKGTPHFYSRKSIENKRKVKELTNIQELNKIARACYFPPFEPAFIILNENKLYLLPEWN